MSDSVELIKGEIAKRAKEEAKRVIADANNQAKEILSTAERKAHEVMMISMKPEVEVMRRRVLGSAHLEGRKMMLQKKDELVQKVLNAVEHKLREIAGGKTDSADYEELLFNLLKEGISGLGENEVLVTTNRRDLSYLSSNIKKIRRRLSDELGYNIKMILTNRPQDYIGGVTVQSKDGLKIYNNTLEGRLLNIRDTLRGKILEMAIR